MAGIIIIVLLFSYIGIAIYGWQLRDELKKTEYWEKLPSGTAIYGYILPVILFILLSKEHVGIIRILLCIFLVIVFSCCVAGLNNSLKATPLEGYSVVLPDDVRKKVVLFNALTPLMTILVIVVILQILDLIFGIIDFMKRQGKN